MSNESNQPSTPLNSAVDLSLVRVLRLNKNSASFGCSGTLDTALVARSSIAIRATTFGLGLKLVSL